MKSQPDQIAQKQLFSTELGYWLNLYEHIFIYIINFV